MPENDKIIISIKNYKQLKIHNTTDAKMASRTLHLNAYLSRWYCLLLSPAGVNFTIDQ